MTLKVATRILGATHCLVMTIICAKQYFNPTTNNKIMAQKNEGRTDNAATFGEHNRTNGFQVVY